MSLAKAMFRVVQAKPDGGEYSINVAFMDETDDIWSYSTEAFARQAFDEMKANKLLKIKYLSLVKEIDWACPGHGKPETAS